MILIFLLIGLPICVTSEKCPSFQSVIALRESSTSANLTYAVVADGKYYLMATEEDNGTIHSYFKTIKDMPKGFEKTRLITVVDRSDCNETQYYHLIAFQSFLSDKNRWESLYSTYDLMDWTESTQWSEPKSISELPLLANDRIKSLMELDPNLSYERLVQTMFFWSKTKTLFVVIKQISDEKSNRLRYYAIKEKESCGQTYHYSIPDYFDSALTSVIEPIDLCFISEDKSEGNSLLYCLGNNSLQINLIDNEFKNGTLQTRRYAFPGGEPSIKGLYPIGLLCNESKRLEFETRLPPIYIPLFGDLFEDYDFWDDIPRLRIGCRADVESFHNNTHLAHDMNRLLSDNRTVGPTLMTTEAKKSDDDIVWIILLISGSTIIIIGLCLLTVMVCERRRAQMARM